MPKELGYDNLRDILRKKDTKFFILFFLVLVILQSSLVYADQSTGSIEISVKYTNHDRADYSSMTLKVYQDSDIIPYKVISSLSDNPYNIVSLPIGHTYKIEVFSNGMYSGTDYIDLQTSHETLDTTIPLPGGIRFTVFYNDGLTPIDNATVSIKSQDGTQWAKSTTDSIGQTTRFWIQPPITDGYYYITDVSIGKNLMYSFSPVKLNAGSSQELKIVTPWPPIVNSLLTAKIFKDSSKTIGPADGTFLVELHDLNGKKITESQANAKGEAYFSNLKVGDYVFRAINLNDNTEWGNSEITINGTQDIVQIFKNPPIPSANASNNQTLNSIKNVTSIINCHCVAFRLDNIQDYWLNNVQTKIIDEFQQKNTSLTIGIIGNSFGSDPLLTNHLQKMIKSDPSIEIANNGWKFEDFSTYDKSEQSLLIKQSNDKIFSLLGKTPVVFIPPYGKINNDTFSAMFENNIMFLSANTMTYQTVYFTSNTIHRFPATVVNGYTNTNNGTLHRLTNDEIFTNIENSMHDYGFAVITISFQDYAKNNGTTAQNEPDLQQMQQLDALIDKIKNSGIKTTTISGISNEQISILIPSWIKTNAGLWSNGKITNSDFLHGIDYMTQNHIISIQNIPKTDVTNNVVPSWIKNNAKWWAENKISDTDFVKEIEFLMQQGIIRELK